MIDPGIGFGKRGERTRRYSHGLAKMQRLLLPVLAAVSRKSFLSQEDPKSLEYATAAAVTTAILNGAGIVRVHDVAAMKPVIQTADAIVAATPEREEKAKPSVKPRLDADIQAERRSRPVRPPAPRKEERPVLAPPPAASVEAPKPPAAAARDEAPRSGRAGRLNAVLLLPESGPSDVPRSGRNESRFNAAMMRGKRKTGRIDGRLNVAVHRRVEAVRAREGPDERRDRPFTPRMNGRLETGRTAGRTSAANHPGKRGTKNRTTGVDVLQGRPMAATKNHTIATVAMIVRGSRISVRRVPKGGRPERRPPSGKPYENRGGPKYGSGRPSGPRDDKRGENVLVVEVDLQRAGKPAVRAEASRRTSSRRPEEAQLNIAAYRWPSREISASAVPRLSDGRADKQHRGGFLCVHTVPLLKRTTASLRFM